MTNKTVNNFDQIRSLLKFDSEDQYYFLQILKRRKENPDMAVGVTVVKEYYIDSLEYFDKKRDSIIEMCEKHNSRAGLRLNRRSYKKTAHALLKDIANKLEQEEYRSIRNSYASASGRTPAEPEKTWILDVDAEEMPLLEGIVAMVDTAQSKYESNVVDLIPSKSGMHIITYPFNPQEFKSQFPTVEIKKDNPTNLYIP